MKEKRKSWKAEIIKLYFENRYSEQTEEKIQEWLVHNWENEEVEKEMKAQWEALSPTRHSSSLYVLRRVNARIGNLQARRRGVGLRRVVRVAAIFVMLMALSGVWLYLHNQKEQVFVAIAAAYGETKQVKLPDQSEIWLNSGSTLKYAKDFNQSERLVSLSGEAFFSVAKDSLRPFIVDANDIKIRVLGTKFNIKAYPEDRQIVATLQEGKVEVLANGKVKQQLLPNDRLTYNSQTAEMQLEEIKPAYIPDWKNGRLLFFEETLDAIVQTLSRRFNVAFNVDKSVDISGEQYTMKFEEDENLEQVLWVLSELTDNLSFIHTNGNVIVKNTNKK